MKHFDALKTVIIIFNFPCQSKFHITHYSVTVTVTECSLLFQEFRSEDVSDLYLEEREQQLTAAQEEKRKVQLSVPGMVNPHDMPEEMQD